jgi:hypothetical protein
MARGSSADLQAIIWFTLVDFEEKWKYGLLNPNYSPKPAYLAYQTLAEELAGMQYSHRLDTGYAEVEGYVFSTECGTEEKGVLWTNPVGGGEVTRDLSFPVGALRVVQKGGEETIVYDGGAGDLDGIADGKVTILITGSPVYVENYP